MSETAWNNYAAERDDARNASRITTRRIAGQIYDERDVPDEDELP